MKEERRYVPYPLAFSVRTRTVRSSGEHDDDPFAFTSADDGGEVEEQAHVALEDAGAVKKDMVALVDEQYVYPSAPLNYRSEAEYVLSSRCYWIHLGSR